MALTSTERACYRALIRELSRMRGRGWQHDTFRDWQPLEAELRALSDKMKNIPSARTRRKEKTA
jgi:hypothetical protein